MAEDEGARPGEEVDHRNVTDDCAPGHWWLWRMSDGSLLPVHTDEDGVDRPFLGGASSRLLEVDHLLRLNVPLRDVAPSHVDGRLLLHHTVGWSAFATMAICAAVRWAPGVPNGVRPLAAVFFWLGTPVIATVVGRRRLRNLPADLRPLARAEIHASLTAIRPVRWRWLAKGAALVVAVALALIVLISLLNAVI